MFRFNGLAAFPIGLIGIGAQLIGSILSGGAAQRAQTGADAAQAAQAEAMREYLEDYRAMRPYRRYMGDVFSSRAAVPSRFTRAWGGQGSFKVPQGEQFYGRPEFPSFDQWKQLQEQKANKPPKDEYEWVDEEGRVVRGP